MFNLKFLQSDPYEDRLIARTEDTWGYISTVAVNDNDAQPFETAISHSLYKEGRLIIVEEYSMRADAAAGHAKWVEIMRNDPAALTDVSSTEDAILYRELGGRYIFPRENP